ncbi:MAG: inverse autotransporter beta domain-containing protein [Parasphingopyxis sp.]|uniref:beta strand repeat-containing protein n=1 Tax=Parasphingopyxis sp. TaxID=1920299 RepID=UPI003F9F036D
MAHSRRRTALLIGTCLAAITPPAAVQAEETTAGNWHPHAEFVVRPGSDESGGGAEFFVPLAQSYSSLLFVDTRVGTTTRADYYSSIGLGVRSIVSDDVLIGGYAFFDITREENDETLYGATVGAELLTPGFDFRTNFYLPASDTRFLRTDTVSSGNLVVDNNQLVERIDTVNFDLETMTGVDAEAGVQLFGDEESGQEFRLYGGVYHFWDSQVDNVTGGRARAEYRLLDAFGMSGAQFAVGAEVSDDNLRGTEFTGEVRLRIPFGSSERIAASRSRMNPIQHRMDERVRRRATIRTQVRQTAGSFDVGVLNNLTGQAFGNIFFVDGANTLGTGDPDDPTTLPDAVTRSGNSGIIVGEGGNGDILTGGETLIANQQLLGGGTPLQVRLSGGRVQTFVLGTTPGTIANTGTAAPTLALADNNIIRNLLFTGGATALFGDGANGVVIDNVMISGVTGIGISLNNSSATIGNIMIGGGAGGALFLSGASTLALSNGVFASTGSFVVDLGDSTVTAFSDIMILGGSGESGGITGDGTIFDADLATAGIQQVAGGDLVIGTSQNRVGGTGLLLTNASGAISFDSASIFTNGSGLPVTIVPTAPAATIARQQDAQRAAVTDGQSLTHSPASRVAAVFAAPTPDTGADDEEAESSPSNEPASPAMIAENEPHAASPAGMIVEEEPHAASPTGMIAENEPHGGAAPDGMAAEEAPHGATGSAAMIVENEAQSGAAPSAMIAEEAPQADAAPDGMTAEEAPQVTGSLDLIVENAPQATAPADMIAENQAQAGAAPAGMAPEDAPHNAVSLDLIVEDTPYVAAPPDFIAENEPHSAATPAGLTAIDLAPSTPALTMIVENAPQPEPVTIFGDGDASVTAQRVSMEPVAAGQTASSPSAAVAQPAAAATPLAATITVSGAGINIDGSSFDLSFAGPVTVNAIGGPGIAFTNSPNGSLTLAGGVTVTSNDGAGILAGDSGALTIAGGSVSATGGSGVALTNILADITLASLDVVGSPGAGLMLDTISGNFEVAGTTTIQGATADGVFITDSTADIALNTLTITSTGRDGVLLNENDGVISVGSTTLSQGMGAGIEITRNRAGITFADVDISDYLVDGLFAQANSGALSFGAVTLSDISFYGVLLESNSSDISFGSVDVQSVDQGFHGRDNSGDLSLGNVTISDVSDRALWLRDGSGTVTADSISASNANVGVQVDSYDGQISFGNVAALGTNTTALLIFGNAAPLTLGDVTISQANGQAILFANNGGAVTLGDTSIGDVAGDAITIVGTNGDIVFGDTDITGLGSGTGVDVSSALGSITFATLNITGTGAAGSVGIDMAGSTNSGSIITTESGDISGVEIGVDLTGANITGNFQYGDGSNTDADGAASTITATTPIVFTGLGATGDYNFLDVVLVGDTSALSSAAVDLFFIDTTPGAGTAADPGTIAQAELSGADIFVLVNDGSNGGLGTIDSAGSNGDETFLLTLGQDVFSFLNQTSFDVVNGGPPSNLRVNGFTSGGTITINDPTGNGAPELLSTTGDALTLAGDNLIDNVLIADSAGASVAIPSLTEDSTITNSDISSVQVTDGSGDVTITNSTLGALGISGGTSDVSLVSVTLNQDANAAAISVSNGHSGSLTIDAASLITANNGSGLQFSDANGSYVFNGAIDLAGSDVQLAIGYSSVLSALQGGPFQFADLTISTLTAGISIAGARGDIVFAGPVNIDTSAGAGRGVDIDIGTTQSDIRFTGGLGVSSGSGEAFYANAGGTLVISGSGNTLASTGNSALRANSWRNLDLQFDNLTSGGDRWGIQITSSGGQVAVTGLTSLSNNLIAAELVGGTADLTFGQLQISNASNTGLRIGNISGTIAATEVEISNTSSALQLSFSGADVQFGDLTIDTVDEGIRVDRYDGAFEVTGATSIAGATTAVTTIAGSGSATFNILEITNSDVGLYATANSTAFQIADALISGSDITITIGETLDAPISFDALEIQLTSDNSVGFDLSGAFGGFPAVLNADITITDFDLTSTSATGTIGVDLSDATGTGTVTIGDTSLPFSTGESATIDGVATGVAITDASDVMFTFGDGEEAVDQASIINATVAIDATGVTGANGSFNFLDVDFGGVDPDGAGTEFAVPDVYYFSETASGLGDGSSAANAGTVAGAETTSADILIPVGAAANAIDVSSSNGDASNALELDDAQDLLGFAAGEDTIDIGFTAPANILIGVTAGQAANVHSDGSPALTQSAGAAENILVLANGNTLDSLRFDGSGGSYADAIEGNGINGLMATDIMIAGATIGIEIINSTGAFAFDTLTIGSPAGIGLSLADNTGGVFTFTGLLDIDVGAGVGFLFTGDGTVDIQDGADIDVTTGTGIFMQSTGSLSIADGLTIDSGAGSGLRSAGGGTVNITGTGNTVTVTTGGAIELDGVTANITFDSLAATAGGVIVGNTSGSFTVTGTTIITNAAAHGIDLFDSSAAFTFGDVTVNTTTDNGIRLENLTGTTSFTGTTSVTDAGDDGIDLNGTLTDVSFATVTITGGVDDGIDMSSVAGTVAFNGPTTINTPGEMGVEITDGSGTYTFTGLTVNDAVIDGVSIYDTDANVTFTNLVVDDAGENGFYAEDDDLVGLVTITGTSTIDDTADEGILLVDGNYALRGITIGGTSAVGLDGIALVNSPGFELVVALSDITVVDVLDPLAVGIYGEEFGDGFYITQFSNITVDSQQDGGILLTGVIFDANPFDGDIIDDTVAGGTLNVGQNTTLAGYGVDIFPAAGDIAFDAVNISSTGDALSILGSGTFNPAAYDIADTPPQPDAGLNLAIAGGVIESTAGQGVVLADLTVDITLGSITAGGGNYGIQLAEAFVSEGVEGTFDVTGAVNITGVSTHGISITDSSVAASFGGLVTIDNTGFNSAGIEIADTTGSLSFTGSLDITLGTGSGIAAIDISNTVGGPISIADLDITLAGDNQTGLSLNGATLGDSLTITDFDLTSTSSSGTIGIDMRGLTGTDVTVGDTSAPFASGQDATIAGVATGVIYDDAANVAFIFGDSEATEDVGSSIAATTAIDFTNDTGATGTYNFLDTIFPTAGSTSNLEVNADVYYIDAQGDGDGSRANPGNFAGAPATPDTVIILVDQTGSEVIDLAAAAQGSVNGFTLNDEQVLASFLNGDIDLADYGFMGGTPANLLVTGVSGDTLITDPGSGAPDLTTSNGGSDVIVLADGSTTIIDGVSITATTGAGDGIFGDAFTSTTITNSAIAGTQDGLSFNWANDGAATTATVTLDGVTVSGGSEGLFSRVNTGDDITITATNSTFTSTGAAGFVTLTGTGGVHTVGLSNLTVDTSSGGGALTMVGSASSDALFITRFEDITVDNAGIAAITISNAIFDADPSDADFTGDTVAGGTLSIGQGGSATGAGLVLNDAAGDLAFDDIQITTAGTGLDVSGTASFNGGAGTGFRLATTTGTINSTGSSGILFDPFTADITLASVSSGGGANNILIDQIDGSVTIAGGALSGSTGDAFRIVDSSANISFGGTIDNGLSRAVFINNYTSGTATFSGAITNSGVGTGILIGGTNTGSTVNFTGGLSLATTGGATIFDASGGVTLNVTGTNAVTSAATARILDWNGVNIGALGATFSSLTGNGTIAGTAISLNNVDGNFFQPNSVAIQDTSAGDAIFVGGGSSAFFNFGLVDINGAADDGIDIDGSGNGTVSFASSSIDGAGDAGIEISDNSGTVFINATVGALDDPNGNAVDINGGSGNITINADVTKGGATTGDVYEIANRSGGTVTIQGSLFSSGVSGGIDIDNSTGGAAISVSGNINFTGLGGIDVSQTSSTGTTTFSGSRIVLNTGAVSAVSLSTAAGHTINFTNGGLDIDTTSATGLVMTGGGTLNITGVGHTIDSTGASAIDIDDGGAATVVGLQGITASGGGGLAVIDINGSGAGSVTITALDDLTISSTGNEDGGIAVETATFDADPGTGGIQTAAGGDTAIGTSLARVQGDGMRLNNVIGAIGFGDLDIFNNNGTGLFIRDAGGKGGSFAFSNTSGTVDTTNGTALDIDPVTMGSVFDSVTASGGVNGVLLDTIAGTLTINGGAISNTSGNAFDINNSTADITYAGTITNTAGRAVEVTNQSAGTITFSGAIDEDGLGLSLVNNTGATINFTGGLDIDDAGFFASAGGTLNITGAGNVISQSISGANMLNLNGVTIGSSGISFASLIRTNNSGFAGIRLANVDGGTLTIDTVDIAGTTGFGSETAIVIQNNDATLNFGSVTVRDATARGIDISDSSGSAGLGSITFGTVDLRAAINGDGLIVVGDTSPITINGGTIRAGSSPVRIIGGSQTISIAAAIENASGSFLSEVTGRTGGTVTFSGNLSATGGQHLNVHDNSGGTTTFSGTSKVLNTSANAAVSLTNNTGHTINFTNGGLDIDTTSGTGFTATGGGTVTVSGTGNTITSGTGTALNIADTTIGAAGATFQSISANGAPNGIVLSSTGSAGFFTVTGDGATISTRGGNGSGGTITGTTGTGISITDAANITLLNMNVTNAGTHGVSLVRVEDVTMNGITLTGNGNANQEHGVYIEDATGNYSFDHLSASGNFDAHIRVLQSTNGTTLDSFLVDDSLFQNVTTGFFEDGIIFEMLTGTTTTAMTFQNSTFANHDGDHIQVASNGSAVIGNLTISGNTMTGTATNLGAGITVNSAGSFSGSVDFIISNNNIQKGNGASTSINVNIGTSTAAGSYTGTISGNTIGTGGVADSAGDTGIAVEVNQNATMTVLIDNNTINSFDNIGIDIGAVDGTGTLNATVTTNTVSSTDINAFAALFVDAQTNNTVCLDAGGTSLENTLSASAGFTDVAFQTGGAGVINLEGYGGAANSQAQIQTFIQGRNNGSPGVQLNIGGGPVQGGGACPTP